MAETQIPDPVLSRRRGVLSPGLRLSYAHPVHAVSASGVWITDADGSRLLDAYNNVPHVGHCRPEVVDAIAAQAAVLNINTRYVTDVVVEYAERLTSMLPDPLDVVYFANSGSEANDLAWRIARTVTGRRGAIVTDNAYHGATYLTMATSPEGLRETGIENPDWLATIPIPESLHHPAIEPALARLHGMGHRPALLAIDTVVSSDGIFDTSAALESLAGQTRAAGALFVADEVQAGFGRVGERLWGFAGSGIVPDIVTFGKPMGNGHPLAAVVTSRDIADRFATRGYYFSTFAGNPVSAAAGMAVLDVLDRDELPRHAERVGAYMRDRLAAIGHPAMAAVRGPGLFIGVDLRDEEGRPNGALAEGVVDSMRDRGVLIGRTGRNANVLKIRPPLVFDTEHAELVVTTLGDVLGEA